MWLKKVVFVVLVLMGFTNAKLAQSMYNTSVDQCECTACELCDNPEPNVPSLPVITGKKLCGLLKAGTHSSKIFGKSGDVCTPELLPWLFDVWSIPRVSKITCRAILIHQKAVLVSSHCVESLQAEDKNLRISRTQFSKEDTPKEYTVDHDHKTDDHSWMLILNEAVDIGKKSAINVICQPDKNYVFTGNDCFTMYPANGPVPLKRLNVDIRNTGTNKKKGSPIIVKDVPNLSKVIGGEPLICLKNGSNRSYFLAGFAAYQPGSGLFDALANYNIDVINN